MIRKRVYQILEVAQKGDLISRIFDYFILILIFLNVVAVIIGTMPYFSENYSDYFDVFEIISVIVFSIEYLLRLWTIVENNKFSAPFSGRIKYIFTPMAICDFMSIFPFFLTFTSIDLRFIRILRLFRIFRIAKIGRYYASLNMIKNVLIKRKEELILSSMVMITLLVLSASVMYTIENPVQPENFSSIPATMWWAVSTLTTVGYGDIYPVTGLGKLMAGLIAIIGVGMFALPTGILASGFVEEIQEKKKRPHLRHKCPECGHEY
jgi:voltage-gated potassium channel